MLYRISNGRRVSERRPCGKEGDPMLMRTDPFRELDRLTQQLLGTNARPVALPMDAYRDGDMFVVQFDVPGTSLDSIDITVEQNVLTVHAERPGVRGDGVELIVSERSSGTFSRQVFLGETLDAENVEADYTAGVLTLRIPVREAAKPRKISIASKDQPALASAS
jgi:HSP20 family protein